MEFDLACHTPFPVKQALLMTGHPGRVPHASNTRSMVMREADHVACIVDSFHTRSRVRKHNTLASHKPELRDTKHWQYRSRVRRQNTLAIQKQS